MLYINIGIINANAVHANAPERLMKRPNLGTIMASMAVEITMSVLNIIFFANGYDYKQDGIGKF